jgi:tetratricopeptide (TPR) repeat protein
MHRLKAFGVSLIFSLPLPAIQHAVAAEGAGVPALPTIVNSSESLVEFHTLAADAQGADEVSRLFGLYMDARVTGTADEADVLAKQIVEVSIRSYGRDSKGTARALTNLANLQITKEENAAAIQNLSAAIDIIERIENNLSLDLVSPLSALGSAQVQAGNADLAQIAWKRAVHISHVNLGPHNYQQIETLYSLSQLLARAGESKAANKVRKQIAYLRSREVAPQDDMLLSVFE